MSDRNKAYIYVALATLLWSGVASAFKIILRELDYIQMLFAVSLTSLLALFLIILLQGKFSQLKSQSGKQILRSALMGLINPFGYYLILFKAYSILPAQEAQPLNWTWPVVLSILSVPLLKQKLRLKSLLGILVSFFGVIIISTHGNPLAMHLSNPMGVTLAVSSSVIWSFYWIFNIKDERDPVIKIFTCFAFGIIYITGALFILTDFEIPSTVGLLTVVYIGLFEMGVTFILWMKALSLAGNNARIAGIAYLTPFISLVFIHFIVGETIAVSSVAGLILIVGGILIGAIKNPEIPE